METYCERCDATETLEDGFTCKECGYAPVPMWGTVNNLYAGLDDEPKKPQNKKPSLASRIKAVFSVLFYGRK